MENSTKLLQRQASALAARRAGVVEADDAALADLPAASLWLHADDFTVAADQWRLLPEVAEDTDLLILPLPKAADRMTLLLRHLAGVIRKPLPLWLVGPAKGGIRGGVTRLKGFADDIQLLDSARHCKLYEAQLRPGPPLSLAEQAAVIEVRGARVTSYPGVFSHGRLDEGSDLLLDALEAADVGGGKALDIGCGAGVLTVWLARAGCRVQALDPSATAVAAARATLADNGLSAEIQGGDLFDGITGRFDLLVTNPPFHDGRERTTQITRRLIRQAPEHLQADGELWLVANRELPYAQWLDDAFRQVTVVRETNRFRVYRARR
ncbi:methyltransferase [Alloalcanivorax xenomutans]|uniref:methyltransferase n=1 Tax=Alloalcanivorax xenomutans TaxID=1094342 RepID=UPI0024E19E35|nr:methyltransferase [Alloalcanivorax xenomutans]